MYIFVCRVDDDVSFTHNGLRNQGPATDEYKHIHITYSRVYFFVADKIKRILGLSSSDHCALSYLKVGFTEFKEFGSGDGPLPQPPEFLPFIAISVNLMCVRHNFCRDLYCCILLHKMLHPLDDPQAQFVEYL